MVSVCLRARRIDPERAGRPIYPKHFTALHKSEVFMARWKRLVFLAVAVFMIATATASERYTTLKEMGRRLKIDEKQISVSGISSGGFMAHQFHVAHSGNLMGAGIIAGGPYYCAEGQVDKGMHECTAFMSVEGCQKFMSLGVLGQNWCDYWFYSGPTYAAGTEVSDSAIKMAENSINATLSGGYNIDDPNKLLRSRVILIHGIKDTLLPGGVMDALDQYYQRIYARLGQPSNADNPLYLKTLPIAHAVPTDNWIGLQVGHQVGTCETFDSPYLNACTLTDCATACPPETVRTHCNDPSNAEFASCMRRDASCLQQCMATIKAAAAILTHIYGGPLNAPREEVKINVRNWGSYSSPIESGCRKDGQVDRRCRWLQERLFVFDQSEVTTSVDIFNRFLSDKGFIFIPPQCANGTTTCKLHIAFHGCRQGYGFPITLIKEAIYSKLWTHFVENAGYNEWADTNDIVVLYPQARRGALTGDIQHVNPQGCWDFWGYTDPKYHTKDGKQIAAVWNMVELLVPALRNE